MKAEHLVKHTQLEASNIGVTLPSMEWFLHRIEKNDPYHFLRVNHAVIDKYCWKFVEYSGPIAEGFEKLPFDTLGEYIDNSDYDSISNSLLSQNTFGYFEDQLTVEDKVKKFVEVFHGYKDVSPKFEISISLGVGLGPIWGRYVEHHPLQSARLRIVSLLVEKNKYRFFHSGVLKHFSVMGELPYFFDKLNRLGHQIVFLGPAYMKHFKDEYDIKNFHHIVTPLRTALDGYGDNVKEIQRIRDEKGKTILFHSTGHIASAWIAYQLKDDNDIWGIDIGRSFDWDISNAATNDSEVDFPTVWTTSIDKKELVKHIIKLRNNY